MYKIDVYILLILLYFFHLTLNPYKTRLKLHSIYEDFPP